MIQANKAGYPDLLCLMPDRVLFIEVKSRTGKLSKVQEYRHAELRAAGFEVRTIAEPTEITIPSTCLLPDRH